ncbi:MAG TPA: hypothetical protein VLX29_11910 [Nitrospirota bacterium]|nr:hypothetical protein [Nitrospirota bacterium]
MVCEELSRNQRTAPLPPRPLPSPGSPADAHEKISTGLLEEGYLDETGLFTSVAGKKAEKDYPSDRTITANEMRLKSRVGRGMVNESLKNIFVIRCVRNVVSLRCMRDNKIPRNMEGRDI